MTATPRCCLGAARYLAETRNFAGDAVVIFQPAEEGGAGAVAMIKDGLMDRFGIEQVYGMHNGPGIPVGTFRDSARPDHGRRRCRRDQDRGARRPRRAAAQMHRFRAGRRAADHCAAVDRVAQRRSAGIGGDFDLRIPRRQCPQRDPANRRADRHRPHPERRVRKLVERRVREVVAGVAQITGAKIDLTYDRGYPVTVNHAAQTDVATGPPGKSPATPMFRRCRR